MSTYVALHHIPWREKKGGDREVSAIAFWRWALLSELALQED